MHRRTFASIVLSATLALTLCPGLAFAGTPSSSAASSADAELAAGSVASLNTQGKTQDIYVVTSRTDTFHYGSGEDQYTSSTYNYSYNKNGLVAKRSNPYGAPTKWSYKGSAISKIVTSDAKATFKIKNGKRISGTSVKSGEGSYNKATEKYTYKGGKLVKCATTKYTTWSDGEHKETPTFTFTYKKGLPVKKTVTEGSASTTINYKFDSRENVVKRYSGPQSTVYKNSYNKLGLLQKTTIMDWDYTLTYKKITVSSSLAKAIQAQQWTIINPDFSYGLYGVDIP